MVRAGVEPTHKVSYVIPTAFYACDAQTNIVKIFFLCATITLSDQFTLNKGWQDVTVVWKDVILPAFQRDYKKSLPDKKQ